MPWIQKSAREWESQRLVSYERIKKEIRAYDNIAVSRMKEDVAEFTRNFVGSNLLDCYLSGKPVEFPKSSRLWIDSVANGISQRTAYNWLAPIEGKRYLQLGGSGSHAIKSLIGGADSAVLVTPSAEEGQIALMVARRLGLASKMEVALGIGEALPFAEGSFDRVYGGGTLHHIELELGLSELHRVLATGGRAGFVDPRLNFIYRVLEITKLRNLARERGAQCYPLRVSDVQENARGFTTTWCELSGGPARYAIVGLTRILRINVPLSLSMVLQSAETRVISALGLSAMLGGLSVLLEK